MWFNSIDFFYFMLAVLPLFFVIGAIRSKSGMPRIIFLIVVSCIFYMWWNPPYIILLFISMIWDYTCGLLFLRWPRARHRLIVAISVTGSLTILTIFKYGRLFYTTACALLAHFGVNLPEWRPEWGFVLPAGLSFYTFRTMSYCIDIYRGKAQTEKSFPRFALFVSFFPQLVAGPIGKARDLLPQYQDLRHNRPVDVQNAVQQMAYGLFKKVAVADSLAMLINPIFKNPHAHSGAMLLTAAIFFSVQIYCDFSGYTDMAIGVAKLFGINLSLNFLFPYFATSVRDFWRKWHISLSTWLREYLYISLGGNRKGNVRTYFNLMITMVLGGLWHGASWNFVLWGFLHGLYLVIHRALDPLLTSARRLFSAPSAPAVVTGIPGRGFDDDSKPRKKTTAWVRIPAYGVAGLFTFSLVTLTWIPFRCVAFKDTATCLRRIFTWAPVSIEAGHIDAALLATAWLLVAALLLFNVFFKLESLYWQNKRWVRWLKPALPGLFIVLTIIFGAEQAQQFIYFQF